jgi:hypothetical protein
MASLITINRRKTRCQAEGEEEAAEIPRTRKITPDVASRSQIDHAERIALFRG